jgi:hypothetical protein
MLTRHTAPPLTSLLVKASLGLVHLPWRRSKKTKARWQKQEYTRDGAPIQQIKDKKMLYTHDFSCSGNNTWGWGGRRRHGETWLVGWLIGLRRLMVRNVQKNDSRRAPSLKASKY